jgi:uncharacterized protein (DUF1778 family)
MRRPTVSVRQGAILHIRLFTDELESIKTAAAAEGKTVSEYVRARVLQDHPPSSQVVKEDPLENLRAPIEKQSPAKVAKQAKAETSPMRMMFAKDKWKKK